MSVTKNSFVMVRWAKANALAGRELIYILASLSCVMIVLRYFTASNLTVFKSESYSVMETEDSGPPLTSKVSEAHDTNLAFHTQFSEFPATTHAGRGDESSLGEGDELSRLRKRNFADYSDGHRRLYLGIISLIGGSDVLRDANILEIGTGIGWGLGKMLEEIRLRAYVGVEPCVKCLEHVKQSVLTTWYSQQARAVSRLSSRKRSLTKPPRFTFFAKTFLQVSSSELELALQAKTADFSFCIEVVEHVDPQERFVFLRRLREWSGVTLFLSTPNKDTRPTDGALTTTQWQQLLQDVGFKHVAALEWQWTTLFICT